MIFDNFLYRTTLLLIHINIIRIFAGLISQIVLAAHFGASAPLDAYLVVFSLPQIFGDFLLGGVIFLVLIPLFVEYKTKEGEESAWDLISSISNIFILFLFIIMLFYLILAPLWLRILAPGFNSEVSRTAINISRILSPLFILMSLIWIATALLNSYNNFVVPVLATCVVPITIIFSVTMLSKQWGIYSLAWAVLIGLLVQLLIQLFFLPFKKYKLQIRISGGVKKSLCLAFPIFVVVIINNLVAIYQRFLASKLSAGNISALNFANYVISAFFSIACIPLITIIFPLLSSRALEENKERFINTCIMGLKLINFISLPITIYLAIFYYPLTKVIFNRGNFGMQDVYLTASALLFLGLGFFAMSGLTLVARIFYSLKDMTTPLYWSSTVLLLSLIVNYFLCKWLEIKGLALATSVTLTINYIVLLYALHRKIKLLRGSGIIMSFIKTLIISLLSGSIAYILFNNYLKQANINLAVSLFISTISVSAISFSGSNLARGSCLARCL